MDYVLLIAIVAIVNLLVGYWAGRIAGFGLPVRFRFMNAATGDDRLSAPDEDENPPIAPVQEPAAKS